MEVRQIIQASAEVVTITSFKPGDVYKRIETDFQGNGSLRFGVVTDVLNNGSESALTALEYRTDYLGLVIEEKVYDGSKPVAIYAAHPDEVREHIANLQDTAARKEREAEEALQKARDAVACVREVADRCAVTGALTSPTVVVGALTSGEPAGE